MLFLSYNKRKSCSSEHAKDHAFDLQKVSVSQLVPPCGLSAPYPHPTNVHEHHSPPPYESATPSNSTPLPSSWASEMSTLADRFQDDSAAMMSTSKQHQTRDLDRKGIFQGIKLVTIAADEYDEGNEAIALDIYLSGLDKIVMAIPNKTERRTKKALKDKLQSVEERVGITNFEHDHHSHAQRQQTPHNSLSSYQSRLSTSIVSQLGAMFRTVARFALTSKNTVLESTPSSVPYDLLTGFKLLGQWVIGVTVGLAILLKKSPLPGLLQWFSSYMLALLIWLDAQFHLFQKAQSFGFECVKLLLALDERYHLHEMASEAVFVAFAASLKAIIAYKETLGDDRQEVRDSFHRSSHLCRDSDLPSPSPKTRWSLFL